MSNIVSIDDKGNLIYEGFLSSKEVATINEIVETLKKELPEIQLQLEQKYGSSASYKYYLGEFLGKLLDKYDIQFNERRKFWDELKLIIDKNAPKRADGKNARRSYYEQCYTLSTYPKAAVDKLSWRHWQDWLDRTIAYGDKRFFEWLIQYPEKIKQIEWREFLKALNEFLKKKETSVFSDEELFKIYDSLMEMCQFWIVAFKQYRKEHPNTAKSNQSWSKKFYKKCFEKRKEKKEFVVTKDICNNVFNNIMFVNQIK